MSLTEVFKLFSDNLNGLMIGSLLVALVFRYIAYRSGKVNHFYFKTFARTIEKHIEAERGQEVGDVDRCLEDLLDKAMLDMPERNLRFKQQPTPAPGQRYSLRDEARESIEEFAHGKRSITHSIKQQVEVFKSAHPPSFPEFASRVMAKDRG